jgi:hypothetical protein
MLEFIAMFGLSDSFKFPCTPETKLQVPLTPRGWAHLSLSSVVVSLPRRALVSQC